MSWALRTAVDGEAAAAALTAAGTPHLGISEEGGVATVWFAERPATLPLPGTLEEVPDQDWNAAWKAGIEPVVVGRVAVVPPWLEPPAGAEVVVVIDPGMAFGTGHHETTTGCLAALQELDLAGTRVVDVGTGTGILAIAAALLGATQVEAVLDDPEATAVARANVAGHHVAVAVRDGSVDAVVGGPADVVVANLTTDVIVRRAAALAGLLREEGLLIASGVSLARVEEAVDALQAAGLAVTVRPGREWAVLLAHR